MCLLGCCAQLCVPSWVWVWKRHQALVVSPPPNFLGNTLRLPHQLARWQRLAVSRTHEAAGIIIAVHVFVPVCTAKATSPSSARASSTFVQACMQEPRYGSSYPLTTGNKCAMQPNPCAINYMAAHNNLLCSFSLLPASRAAAPHASPWAAPGPAPPPTYPAPPAPMPLRLPPSPTQHTHPNRPPHPQFATKLRPLARC